VDPDAAALAELLEPRLGPGSAPKGFGEPLEGAGDWEPPWLTETGADCIGPLEGAVEVPATGLRRAAALAAAEVGAGRAVVLDVEVDDPPKGLKPAPESAIPTWSAVLQGESNVETRCSKRLYG
jgi:hypothetical protein